MAIDFRDLDQKLFGWVWGLWKRTRSAERRASAVDFATVEPKLAMLACVVAERRLRLVPTADRGGPMGDALRLPLTIDALATAPDNAMLYVLRTALDASLVRLDLEANADVDDATASFAALLLVPSLLDHLAVELPGVLRIAEALRPTLHARLDAFDVRSDRHRAVYAVLAFCLAPDAPAALPLTEAERTSLCAPTTRDVVARAFAVAERLVTTTATKGDALADLGLPLIGAFPRFVAASPLTTDAPPEPRGGGTERNAPPRDALRRVDLSDDAEDENPLVHSFEKVHTAEAYKGGKKSLDGEDELADHADALDEVALHEVIRTRASSKSTYRMDVFSALGGAPEDDVPSAGPSVTLYDEWSGKGYREGYCRVVTEQTADPALGATGPRVPPERMRRVRRVFESLEDARRLRLRQPSGSEVDVDAVVARYAFVRAGREGADRLYAARRPVEQDLATLLLLDTSSSADGWLDGRNVMELEREAAACVGDALAEIKAPFAVAGFYSHTHSDCRFVSVKTFRGPWASARARLSMLRPTGYTRIGPAIRHATSLLGAVGARRRALLLVTDGRPTDYDHYEGRYGIDDVRMAIREAERAGITPFALCVAATRTAHLREMFGDAGYEVVRRPDELAEKLVMAQARFRGRGAGS